MFNYKSPPPRQKQTKTIPLSFITIQNKKQQRKNNMYIMNLHYYYYCYYYYYYYYYYYHHHHHHHHIGNKLSTILDTEDKTFATLPV